MGHDDTPMEHLSDEMIEAKGKDGKALMENVVTHFTYAHTHNPQTRAEYRCGIRVEMNLGYNIFVLWGSNKGRNAEFLACHT